jgi:hypothetical protein
MTEPTVNSLAQESALLMALASRFPAVAPFTMAAVMPSMPCAAPRAHFTAEASMLDRLALTLLMDALALFVSTSTTSSSLLSAMRVHLFAVQRITLLFQRHQRLELVRADLIEADSDAQLQRRPKVERAAQQQTRLGGLRRVQPVQRAVVAAAAIVRSVWAEAGVTEFRPAQGPVNQEPQGGFFGPLPGAQFGSGDSSKAPSSASIAAFTATAWWTMGTSPA